MLLSLPNELILDVVDHFTETTDVFYLLMTNKRLSNLLRPTLDKVSDEIIDAAANSNLPLLHYAALVNKLTFAKLALKLDPGCVNQYITGDGTAMHIAVLQVYEDIVEFLLDHGADPNITDPNTPAGTPELTPLHLALEGIAEIQNADGCPTLEEGVVKLLLRRGADPNTVDEHGMNALLHAARLGLPSIVAAVLDTGTIDVNSCNASGATALHIASGRSQCGGVPELLVARGINVNAVNVAGQTALFYARLPCVTTLLVKSGADVGVADRSNRTVLHYLAECVYPPHPEVIADIILSAGGVIDLGLKDRNGQSVMDIAKARRNEEFVRMLEKYL